MKDKDIEKQIKERRKSGMVFCCALSCGNGSACKRIDTNQSGARFQGLFRFIFQRRQTSAALHTEKTQNRNGSMAERKRHCEWVLVFE